MCHKIWFCVEIRKLSTLLVKNPELRKQSACIIVLISQKKHTLGTHPNHHENMPI